MFCTRAKHENTPTGRRDPQTTHLAIRRRRSTESTNANARDVDAAAQRDARVRDVTVRPPPYHPLPGRARHRSASPAARPRPAGCTRRIGVSRKQCKVISSHESVRARMMCVWSRALYRTGYSSAARHRVRSHQPCSSRLSMLLLRSPAPFVYPCFGRFRPRRAATRPVLLPGSGKLGKPIPFQPARSSDRKAGCSNGRSHWGMLVLSSSCASFCNIVTLEFQHLSASILAPVPLISWPTMILAYETKRAKGRDLSFLHLLFVILMLPLTNSICGHLHRKGGNLIKHVFPT